MKTPISFEPALRQAGQPDPIFGGRVELQLLTTLKCNLKCSYCSVAKGDVLGSQGHVSYTGEQLDAFIRKHLAGKDVYVTFYGGEPTLNRKFMEDAMRRYPHYRFQLQTNGTLLDDLPDWLLARLSNILVSIDGGERVTDGYRGRGVYRQVMKNLGKVRGKLGGSLTARVTWSSDEISFEHLDELTSVFDYVYFQFVAGEAYAAHAMDCRKRVLQQLVERFFRDPERLYPLIPIMGAVRNKVMPARAAELCGGKTQCRVSSHILNVMPDGKIFPCPDMLYLPEMQMGDLVSNWLAASPLQPHPDMPCASCEAHSWCRGNCMKNLYLGYVRKDERWRESVTDPICDLVRFMGREIDRYDPMRWFGKLALPVRKQIADCEVYEYVEIMP
ncbi:MAG: radical SAM protein [Betaproteobacteria bacterium]|nr:radical SAM protein [Betaproteobacteria bacterium]